MESLLKFGCGLASSLFLAVGLTWFAELIHRFTWGQIVDQVGGGNSGLSCEICWFVPKIQS